ncbi:arsenate reductase ArsC [Methylovorus mays]|uniref:arsenate reductase ArsC n=1 Tax=Methylovorus mays TaxID=184077 RepID=UPI001E2D5927|nr:arsenate reductase ArsC [Methylovorus mays]MCB5206551.1 arsenate reductase ArsC [Methylovorus mays]
MSENMVKVLILCTGNSARSIMAEALFNILGQGRFKAYSAGSHPNGKVNPYAVEQVAAIGYDTSALRSKSWDEFARADAPQMDFIITVCDNAAGEFCPVWPGQPIAAHWGFEDPAAVQGTDVEKRAAFKRIFQQIESCVAQLVALPLSQLTPDAIRHHMQAIGQKQQEQTS